MTLRRWLRLPEDQQRARSQDLSRGEMDSLAPRIENKFREVYGGQAGVVEILCGEVGHLGPVNGIVVRIVRGSARVRLPESFLGFPVFREYQRRSGEWWRKW